MAYQTWIADKIRSYGVHVIEVNGWQTRGGADFNPKAVMAHHTASAQGHDAPALRICTHGRSDLPGPLCQVLLSRSGIAYIVAAGRANHAGKGDFKGLTLNSQFFGIEAENDGRGEPWNPTQVEAYYRICAALLEGIGKSGGDVVAHLEYALPKGRKIDPAGIDMGAFRWQVDQRLRNKPTAPAPVAPTPPSTGGTFRPESGDTLEFGESGPRVKDWQAKLVAHTGANIAVDGKFGQGTKDATINFQRFFGLTADGIAGPKTIGLMNYIIASKNPSRPVLRVGSRGDDVVYLQKKIGYVGVDGIFGAITEARVKKLQRMWGLKADGIVGPNTWAKVNSL